LVRKPNAPFNASGALETANNSIGAVKMAIKYGSLIIVRREGEVRLHSSPSFKTESMPH
jgi:hypothetical protein